MHLGIVRLGLAQSRRARHLRHDGGAAAADNILIEQENARTVARCRDGSKHSSATTADHKDVAFQCQLVGHWSIHQATCLVSEDMTSGMRRSVLAAKPSGYPGLGQSQLTCRSIAAGILCAEPHKNPSDPLHHSQPFPSFSA
jgi:hypothetical protein